MDASEKSSNNAELCQKIASLDRTGGWQFGHWRASGRLAMVAVGLSLAAAAIHRLSLDNAVSSGLRSWHLPGDLAKAVDLAEVFGHGLGAGAILLSVWCLAPTRRTVVWLAIAITVASGVTANAMKTLFVRVRPHATESIQVIDPSAAPPPPSIRATEARPGELQQVQASVWDSRQRSFPSGHAATAWGLAIGLSLVFPRGIVLFAIFATLASLQRLTSGAHFPTDILAGAAVAFVLAAGLLMLPWLRKL